MAVTINAKGTSVSTFTVGKNGLELSQSGSIAPPINTDLTINLDEDQALVINAGPGPALITTSDDQDLHINSTAGGGQYLVLNSFRWPVIDGTSGQVLRTNGAGVLTFGSAPGSGPDDGVFYTNEKVVSGNYTLDSSKNAMTAGPIAINDGVTVTIDEGARWVIV